MGLSGIDFIPKKYQGMDRFEARKAIVADLDAQGFLVETKKHKLMVPRCARTGQVVEPMLTDQWFVAMSKVGEGETKSIAQKAIDAVQSGQVRFVPGQWVNTYNQWMGNIQDWCISRQLWWGHQIPAWYGEDGRVFVARSEQEARAQASAAGYEGALERDPDVLTGTDSTGLHFDDDFALSRPRDIHLFNTIILRGMGHQGPHFFGQIHHLVSPPHVTLKDTLPDVKKHSRSIQQKTRLASSYENPTNGR